jgi:aspartate aminotransferase-like enzyme
MLSPVYLDTARLGRISPTAMAIQTDYLRFSAEQGSSHALRDLLTGGGQAWPKHWQQDYPHLSKWRGIPALKERLCEIVGTSVVSSVMLANRPHALMLLAAHLLARSSTCILTTDLAWPPFQETLSQVAKKSGRRIVRVRLRHLIRSGGDAEAVTQTIAKAYQLASATALFLPAITHDGIRLPLGQIAERIRKERELRFFVVDGAQHFAHGVTTFSEMHCDFYLAGTHKWLRSLYPLGVAIYARGSNDLIVTTRDELRSLGLLNDPLVFFAAELEGRNCNEVTETINLSGLLSAYGAALDSKPPEERKDLFSVQLANAAAVSERAEEHGWRLRRHSADVCSGIQVLRPPATWTVDSKMFQRHIEQCGVVATTYQNGAVRMSLPQCPLAKDDLETIHGSFRLR